MGSVTEAARTLNPIARIVCSALYAGTALHAPASAQERRLPPPSGQRRLALVVGNDGYPELPLKNAVADAHAMAAALQDLGFAVDLAVNADLPALERAVDAFVGKLRPGDAALFYYSGHGIELDGANYLVPVSFKAQDAVEAKYQSYAADRVHERMLASGAGLCLVVLDACRDNPFRLSRSGARGLAPMQAGKGSYIAFATAPGKTASDNPKGRNGLFTGYLVEALGRPGLSLDQVFSQVRAQVNEASSGQQLPWTASSVIGDFYFRPGSTGATPATTASRPDAEFWRSVRDSQDPRDYAEYLAKYPTGEFAGLAGRRLEGLKPQGSPAASHVVVLVSVLPPSWQPTLDALRKALPEVSVQDLHGDRTQANAAAQALGRDAIAVAMGPLAVQAVAEAAPQARLVYSMVADPARLKLPQGAVGVAFALPMKLQLASFRLVAPSLKRLGVIYNVENSGKLVEEASRAAPLLRLALVSRTVGDPRDVPAVLSALLGSGEIDALWIPPDPVLLGDETRRHMFAATLRAGKPVLGFSSWLVAEGALVSSGPDAASIGESAAQLVKELQAGHTPQSPSIPRSELVINQTIANRLGIEVPADALKAAAKLY